MLANSQEIQGAKKEIEKENTKNKRPAQSKRQKIEIKEQSDTKSGAETQGGNW